MSRITDITLMEQSAYYALTVRKTIHFMNEFENFSAQGYLQITNLLKKKEKLPAGAAFVCFHNFDLEQLDVEVGFPIVAALKGEGDIHCIEIPQQNVVTAIDQGPYELQDPTLEELFSWIKNSSYEMLGDIYYQYLNTSNRPAKEYLTKMVLPVI